MRDPGDKPVPAAAQTPAPTARILLVEDDPAGLQATKDFLEAEGLAVVPASRGAEALEHLADGIALIVTDLQMPGMDGMQLLREARRRAPHAPVIMVTGHGSQRLAVEALKAGAFHYVTKPVDPEELISLIRQALEKNRMALQIAALHEQLRAGRGVDQIIGNSAPLREVFEKIRMVADTRSTVLVEGESGTGKELVARAIHRQSGRASGPFVAINCAALPEALVESELFGHERGAFTGASEKRIGKFQAAQGGTLLIDEIGEMRLDLQGKLLRAIETHRVAPVGSDREVEVDVRIVASTHRSLRGLVTEGKFREDLFYRLNVVHILLPPLREHRQDIPLLVRYFIDQIARETGRPGRDVSPEALELLRLHAWPGNVRQLRNTLESIIVLTTHETIEPADLPAEVRGGGAGPAGEPMPWPGMTLAQIEKEAIRQALAAARGNRAEAARRLGVSARTIHRKIIEYQLE